MTRLAICLFAVIATQTNCFAEITKFPHADRMMLEKSATPFKEIHSKTNLSPSVIELCADSMGKLAEPGQKWQETDTVTDSSLPNKRLIWAATNDLYLVVHYELGGRGHSFHVLVAKLIDGESKPEVVWRGVCSEKLKELKAFFEALKSKNALDDNLDYAH